MSKQRFSYNKTANRFQVSDRYASQLETFKMTRNYIEAKKGELLDLGEKFHTGLITGRDFQLQSCGILKSIHIANATLGKASTQLSNKDLGIIENILQQQFYSGVGKNGKRFGIRHLSKEVLDGLVSSPRLRQRLLAYVESGNISLSAMQQEKAFSQGFIEERRIRKSEHSCPSCILYESLGWQPLRSLPLLKTQCECGAGCKCEFEYR